MGILLLSGLSVVNIIFYILLGISLLSRHCRQMEIGCPAVELFGGKKEK